MSQLAAQTAPVTRTFVQAFIDEVPFSEIGKVTLDIAVFDTLRNPAEIVSGAVLTVVEVEPDGSRRPGARALGITERHLYRLLGAGRAA